jgi:acetoin utilization deacetylase AcuC-like enzyme
VIDQPRTGWVFHERYLWHDTGTGAGMLPAGGWLQPWSHVESAASKQRLHSLVAVSGLLDHLEPLRPAPAPLEALQAVHTPEHVEHLQSLSAAGGGDAGDGVTPFGSDGFEIARLAAGGAIAAFDWVLGAPSRNAYCLVRPPGHHAGAAAGMGFCLFNNVAVGIAHARARHGMERIAVVDWDVHHGNGTQSIFYADPGVLTVSIHQDRCFPVDTGGLDERGEGDGYGYNVNVPLPAGSGHEAYAQAMARVVVPALRSFAPDLIVVACGFDASVFDPMGRMLLDSETFRALASVIVDEADSLCAGRLVGVHEGGYSEFYVPFCGLAVAEVLAGRRTAVTDPYAEENRLIAGHELTPAQDRVIEAAAARG